VVVRALERQAAKVPVMPGEEEASYAEARRADALVAICSARLGHDPDPDRATVVVHAQAQGLYEGTGGSQIEGGPVIHPETAKRLLCNARVQVVLEDSNQNAMTMGGLSREPSAAMMRQLRYRDRECRFPGCGSRRFTQAHHIVWRRHGGRTELSNLVLVCSFHHKLVHEYSWRLERMPNGEVIWRRPDGGRFIPGPAPPEGPVRREPYLAVVGA
jgi:hypothetical protein